MNTKKGDKIMKKKLVTLFLSGLLVMSLATGCSAKPAEQGTQEQAAPEAEKTIASVEKTKVYVTPEWVKSVIDKNQPESENYIILEAAWGTEKDSPDYLKAHLPGAIHLNTDEIEEPEYWNIRNAEEITAVMSKYGITKDTTVIVYGPDSGTERVAFVMLWAGVENVKVLDGGLAAWTEAGYETEEGNILPTATTEEFGVQIPAHPEYVIAMPKDAREAMNANDKFRLVSIRSLDEFTGKISGYSYIEKTGEPEGALWGHDEFDYYNEDGTIADFDKAVQMWSEQGITKENEIAFYCGTGWRACVPWLMAYENGWTNVKLFDGGWFAWQMDETNPVQKITPEEAAARYN